jgi:hypothetical protein
MRFIPRDDDLRFHRAYHLGTDRLLRRAADGEKD